MQWLKEILEKNGVASEVIQNVVTSAEEKLKGFIPKHRFDEVNEAKKQLEEQLTERDKQLAELKKSVGDNEELKKRIEELQKENKDKEEGYKAKLRDLQVNAAIKLAVAGKAHDPDLIVNLLDKDKIEIDEQGNIKGLDDQLKTLQESKAFLFVQQKENDWSFKGINPFDGADQQGKDGDKDANGGFGKRLASMNNQSSEALQKAQADYFK